MKIKKINILYLLVLAVIFSLASCSNESPVDLGEKPVADFSSTLTADSIEVGGIITFTDVSTNDPYLYKWTIPGGNPTYSNESSVEVEFLSEGSQPVTLKVRNDAGADEITKYIKVTPLNIPDLDITPLVKMCFENDLENEGSVGGAGSNGSGNYVARSKYGGMALDFTGSEDVRLEDYNGINGANSRTVACWIKTTYDSNSGLVHWGDYGTKSRSSFKFHKSGKVRYEYQGGGITASTLVNDGEWHHVAYTYDGEIVRLYVDGVEDVTHYAVINTGCSGETCVYIGSQKGSYKFQGAIDDVRIYDTVLTADQIKFLSTIN